MKILHVAIFLFALVAFCNAQDSNKADKTYPKDTIYVTNAEHEIDKQYIELLERTNSQMSNNFNPWAIMVAALSALIAVGGIVTAIILYLQSKDYKRKLDDSIKEHNEAINKLISEKSVLIDSIATSIISNKQQIELESNLDEEQKTERINKLNIDKYLLTDSNMQVIRHAGWTAKDIGMPFRVNKYTRLLMRVDLIEVGQEFVFYLRVKTQYNILMWIGFAGNRKIEDYRSEDEITRNTHYEDKVIYLNIGVCEEFQSRFNADKFGDIASIDIMRFRAVKDDPRPVTFSFSLLNIPDEINQNISVKI